MAIRGVVFSESAEGFEKAHCDRANRSGNGYICRLAREFLKRGLLHDWMVFAACDPHLIANVLAPCFVADCKKEQCRNK